MRGQRASSVRGPVAALAALALFLSGLVGLVLPAQATTLSAPFVVTASGSNTNPGAQIRASAFDAAGNMYFAGQIRGTITLADGSQIRPVRFGNSTPDTQAVLFKLLPDGSLAWVRLFGDTNSRFDSLSLNPAGTQIAVVGQIQRGANNTATSVNMNPGGTAFDIAIPTGFTTRSRAALAIFDLDGLLEGGDAAWLFNKDSTSGFAVHWNTNNKLLISGSFTGDPNVPCPSSAQTNFHLDSDDTNTTHATECPPAFSRFGFVAQYDASNLAGSPKLPLDWMRTIAGSTPLTSTTRNYQNIDARYLDVDGAGAVYVGVDGVSTGFRFDLGGPDVAPSVQLGSNQRRIVAKFSSSGVPQWGFGVLGSGTTRDLEGVHIHRDAVDQTGASDKLYVFGMMSGTADQRGTGSQAVSISAPNAYSPIVLQYDIAGEYQWSIQPQLVAHPTGTTQELGRFSSLASDDAGNIYLTGNYRGTVDFDTSAQELLLTPSTPSCLLDRSISSYDSNGNVRWAERIGDSCDSMPETLATATVFDSRAGNQKIIGVFSPTGTSVPFIAGLTVNGIPAQVKSISSSPPGAYRQGQTLSIQVTFSRPVTVSGSPRLRLAAGSGSTAFAEYSTGSGGSTLTFTYSVGADDNTADLDYEDTSSLELNGGSITFGDGDNANLTLPLPGASGSLGATSNVALDNVAPALVSSSPANNSSGFNVSGNLALTLSEAVKKQAGDITVYSGATCSTTLQTIPVTNSRVTITGSTVTLSFAGANALPFGTQLCLGVQAGAITDLAGNDFAGLAESDLKFETQADVAPNAPTNVTVTPGDEQLSVLFTAPSSNGGSLPTNYSFSTDGGSTWTDRNPASTATTFVISGLTNGTTYSVQVRAINGAGPGAASASVSANPVGVPFAPTITGITPGDSTLSVAFTAPGDGGSSITNYKYSIDGTNYVALNPVSTSSPLVITGLTNGTAYTVTIRAVNSIGDSPSSAPQAATPAVAAAPPPATTPPPPAPPVEPEPAPTPESLPAVEDEPEATPSPSPTPTAQPAAPAPSPRPTVNLPAPAAPAATPSPEPTPEPSPTSEPTPQPETTTQVEPEPTPAAASAPRSPRAAVVASEQILRGAISIDGDADQIFMPAVVLEEIAFSIAPPGAPIAQGTMIIESGQARIVIRMIAPGDVGFQVAELGSQLLFTLQIPGFETSSLTVAIEKQTAENALGLFGIFGGLAILTAVAIWWLLAGRRRRGSKTA